MCSQGRVTSPPQKLCAVLYSCVLPTYNTCNLLQARIWSVLVVLVYCTLRLSGQNRQLLLRCRLGVEGVLAMHQHVITVLNCVHRMIIILDIMMVAARTLDNNK